MDKIVLEIFSFISGIPVGLVLFIVFMIGMYVFWRGCTETGKDRSSTFDVYIGSLALAVMIGRLSYILSNLADFTGYIWYWSPYEKYGDVIYMFRLLPWRFFRIWDGGIVILSLFVGYLLFSSVITIFLKKWRWRQMYFTVFFSGIFLLSLSLIFSASISMDTNLLLMSSILLTSAVIFSVASVVVSRLKIKWKRRKKTLSYIGLGLILGTVAYLSFTTLTGDISNIEKISIYTLDAWTFLSSILFVIDMRRKTSLIIKKMSSVQGVSLPEINQPIKLPSRNEKK